MHRAPFTAMALATVIVSLGRPGGLSANARTAATTVAVRLFDNFGVTPRDLSAATTEARGIFLRAEIDLLWRDCSRLVVQRPPVCVDVPAPNEVILRLVASPTPVLATDRVSLGSSLVDLERARGVLATVFPDRVQMIARAAGVDSGPVLGRVIAHELGHLLLGIETHAAGGLMRGFWSGRSLQRTTTPADWVFSSGESASMRSGLLARLLTQDGRQLAQRADGCRAAPELSSPACDGSFEAISTGSSVLP